MNKKSNFERKMTQYAGSINNSNKAQKKRIAKVTAYDPDIPQVPLCDVYMRNKGIWIHKGKSCRLCNLIMNDQYVIDKHRYICKVLNKKRGDDDYADS